MRDPCLEQQLASFNVWVLGIFCVACSDFAVTMITVREIVVGPRPLLERPLI
jgi:hypothetical protein